MFPKIFILEILCLVNSSQEIHCVENSSCDNLSQVNSTELNDYF